MSPLFKNQDKWTLRTMTGYLVSAALQFSQLCGMLKVFYRYLLFLIRKYTDQTLSKNIINDASCKMKSLKLGNITIFDQFSSSSAMLDVQTHASMTNKWWKTSSLLIVLLYGLTFQKQNGRWIYLVKSKHS